LEPTRELGCFAWHDACWYAQDFGGCSHTGLLGRFGWLIGLKLGHRQREGSPIVVPGKQ
jgi:hypothetical protein